MMTSSSRKLATAAKVVASRICLRSPELGLPGTETGTNSPTPTRTGAAIMDTIAHAQVDSGYGSSASLHSVEHDSIPRCSEYFHNADVPISETRQCVNKHHPRPHFVCKTCYDTVSSWEVKRSRHNHKLPAVPVLPTEQYAPLCMPCTVTAREDPEIDAQDCTCQLEWRCFECRDLVAWRGIVDLREIVQRENKKKKAILELRSQDKPIECNKMELCPGCEAWFHLSTYRGEHHAHLCLACKGVSLASNAEAVQPLSTSVAAFPLLKGPCTGHAATNRRREPHDDDIAPDELPPIVIASPDKVEDLNPTCTTTTARAPIENWSFPRSSEVRIGIPPEGANACSPQEAEALVFAYTNYNDPERCFKCGRDEHYTWNCDKCNRHSEEEHLYHKFQESYVLQHQQQQQQRRRSHDEGGKQNTRRRRFFSIKF